MNRVIKVLFFTGILVALSNYFEFITAINLAHIFPNVSNELDFWIYEKVSGVNRVFGLKADPVVTSYYLTFVFPLGLYLYHYEKKKKWLFYTILIVIASILNFTRASMVSIIVMVFIYLFVVSSNRKVKIIFSIALLILIFTIDNPVKQLFIDTLTTFTSNTTSGFDYTRTLGLFDALPSMIDKIPFWGIGTGSLGRPDLIIDYYNKIGFLYSSASVRTELPFIITTLLDGGYIESLSFLFLLLVVITKSLSLVFGSINRKKEIGSYLLMIFIGYFICLTFNGIFDIFSIIYLMIGILNMQLILKKIQHDNTILKCL